MKHCTAVHNIHTYTIWYLKYRKCKENSLGPFDSDVVCVHLIAQQAIELQYWNRDVLNLLLKTVKTIISLISVYLLIHSRVIVCFVHKIAAKYEFKMFLACERGKFSLSQWIIKNELKYTGNVIIYTRFITKIHRIYGKDIEYIPFFFFSRFFTGRWVFKFTFVLHLHILPIFHFWVMNNCINTTELYC